MAVFGVVLQREKAARDFVTDTHRRLQEPNMMRNPFNGEARLLDNGMTYTALVRMMPLYPSMAIIGWLLIPVVYYFAGLSWYLLIALPFLFLGFVRSRRFQYWLFRHGLRRCGYVGSVRLVDADEMVERLMRKIWDRKK